MIGFRTMHVTINSYQHRSICVCNVDPGMNQITESSLILKWISTKHAYFDLQQQKSHRTKFNSSLYISVNTPENSYYCFEVNLKIIRPIDSLKFIHISERHDGKTTFFNTVTIRRQKCLENSRMVTTKR